MLAVRRRTTVSDYRRMGHPFPPSTPDIADRHEAWMADYATKAAARDRASWAMADSVLEARTAGVPVTSTATGKALDLSAVKLRSLASIAVAFPPDKRAATLSFEVHSYLAGMPAELRFATLEKAVAQGWGEVSARRAAAAYRQEQAGFDDEDKENSQAVIIMRAWNRASPEAREYFAELQQVVGLGLVHEDAACGG